MSTVPDPLPFQERRLSRPLKLVVAVGIFCTVISGYTVVEQGRAASAERAMLLPGAAERSGACTLWFIGSSTIFRWQTLRRDAAPWDAHNRGVNGALIPQIVQWFDNEPPGNRPAAIVFYAGENDIAGGATGAAAFTSFQRFMAAKTARFGDMPVIALSLKPSPTRWEQRAEQTGFNDALRRYAARRDDLGFLDIRPLMLTNGRPGPFYADDGIHMNETGYDRWSRTLRPALVRLLPTTMVDRCVSREDRR